MPCLRIGASRPRCSMRQHPESERARADSSTRIRESIPSPVWSAICDEREQRNADSRRRWAPRCAAQVKQALNGTRRIRPCRIGEHVDQDTMQARYLARTATERRWKTGQPDDSDWSAPGCDDASNWTQTERRSRQQTVGRLRDTPRSRRPRSGRTGSPCAVPEIGAGVHIVG